MTATASLPTPAAGVPRRRPDRVQAAILAWHARDGRQLTFRRTTDPWAILVGEVMAQQTRIDRVEAAWPGFLERFPTPRAMAAASPADVLRAWVGLGYNRRAIALHRTAITIAERHDGRVPADLAALEGLPGIGTYTARAILAQSFGIPVAAVDVNVRRVLTRLLLGGDHDGVAPAKIQVLADRLVPPDRPAAWTHALMDLGATVCRARSPRCGACPVAAWCAAVGVPARDLGAKKAPRTPGPRFESTRRWLRGRIVEDLRALRPGRWTTIAGPRGAHDAQAVASALDGLIADGLIERAPDGRVRLPSQVAAAG